MTVINKAPFVLQALTRNQTADVLALECECMVPPWSEASLAAALEATQGPDQPAKAAHYWAHGNYDQESNRLIGYILVLIGVDEMELLRVAVTPGRRRSGIALALLEGFIAQAKHHGVRRILLEVAVSNSGAQALYRRLGFVSFATRERYYGHVDGSFEDAYLMQLFLDFSST
jgi:[ribosomal protein S18]-alanine N-acetyltransferase